MHNASTEETDSGVQGSIDKHGLGIDLDTKTMVLGSFRFLEPWFHHHLLAETYVSNIFQFVKTVSARKTGNALFIRENSKSELLLNELIIYVI